jgi:RNA polymerase sigma-70 factor (ECF subfamily)
MVQRPAEVDDESQRPVVEAIRQGDSYAMTEFVRRNEHWVRGVIFGVLGRNYDLDDVAQRVWIQVWGEARRLEDPAKWRPWVYRIARNAATDAGRRRSREKNALVRVAEQEHATAVPVDVQLAGREQQDTVLEAIAALPEIYREPFVLKHVEDMSYKQIGELLDLPPDTVETRLVRARRLLRDRLAGKV